MDPQPDELRTRRETEFRGQDSIDRFEAAYLDSGLLGTQEYTHLRAQLESMAVIEQAKGILMAQHHCGPDEAFDILRRATQRMNVKVSV